MTAAGGQGPTPMTRTGCLCRISGSVVTITAPLGRSAVGSAAWRVWAAVAAESTGAPAVSIRPAHRTEPGGRAGET
ncbi:hypothetical protein CJD44_35735 [Streptomyces sp. alain-838]|nr:hypothetical protein CJD44_35735 [Streptomyces sp. alain-838]